MAFSILSPQLPPLTDSVCQALFLELSGVRRRTIRSRRRPYILLEKESLEVAMELLPARLLGSLRA